MITAEIVKPMARGQITLPVKIRKKLNITPKTWLWIKLVKDKILIETVEKETNINLMADYLKKTVNNRQMYWQEKDSLNLKKVSQKSFERLKRFT